MAETEEAQVIGRITESPKTAASASPDLQAELQHFRRMKASEKEKRTINLELVARQNAIIQEKASEYPEVGGNYEASRQQAVKSRAEANRLHSLAGMTADIPPGFYDELKNRRDSFTIDLVQEQDMRDNFDAYGKDPSTPESSRQLHVTNCITIEAGIQALDEWLEANKSAAK